MPRPRKPLVQQKGNLTVLQQNKKKLAENMIKGDNNRLAEPPGYLNGEVAETEWTEVTKQLTKMEIICNLDLGNVVVYCNAFADYVEATEHCRSEKKVITRGTATGEILVKNPWVELQKQYADEMRKTGAKIGIDVGSRLKAAGEKVDKKQEEMKQEFGI